MNSFFIVHFESAPTQSTAKGLMLDMQYIELGDHFGPQEKVCIEVKKKRKRNPWYIQVVLF